MRACGIVGYVRILGCAICVALLLAGRPARATDMFGEGYRPCGDRSSTPEIVACVDAKTREWDRRLNRAYSALLDAAGAARREPLRKAQRLWLQFRDANCGFYATAEGSISRVEGAECVRAMTQDRALEFEQALRP